MSLKTRIALLTLFTALMVGIGVAAWSSIRTHEILIQELEERGVSIGTALAETTVNLVVVRDKVSVFHGLRRLLKVSEDISYIYITDFDGTIFSHTFEADLPEALLQPAAAPQGDTGTRHREFTLDGQQIFEVTLPLIGGMEASVTIGMDAAFVHQQIERIRLQILAVAVGIGMLVSLLGIYLGARVVAPIGRLVEQMNRYGRGEPVSTDEMQKLARSKETEALSYGFLDMIRARQQAQSRLNLINDTLDNTMDAVFMFYPDSLDFFYVNRGAMKQLGYGRDELLAMTPVDIKPLMDEAHFRHMIAPLLSGERESYTFETLHRDKQGRDIPVEIFLQYLAEGEPPHFLAIVRDISERKHAEQALLEERNFIDAVLDNAGALIAVLDKQGRIRRFNRACEQLTQYSFAEVEGHHPWDFLLLPEERDVVRERAFKALAENPQALTGNFTNYWLAKDGSGRLIEWHNSLLLDSEGRMEYMVTIGNDITERMRVEAELQQIKTSLDNTMDAVFMFYPDSLRFFYVNQGALKQLGYTRDELLGMTPVDIKPEMDEARFRDMVTPLLSGEAESHTFETVHRSKDGQDIPVEIFLQYMADGEPAHFLAIVRDISERKRAEQDLQQLNRELEQRVEQRTIELASTNEQLRNTLDTLQTAQDELVRSEKLASLGSLVAGVAHELNTPLGNSVTIGTTLQEWLTHFKREIESGSMRRSTLNQFLEQADEATGLLIRNLARAAELISDFKQVAVDQTSAQRRDFDLQRVVTEVIETLQPQFKKTPHRIQLDIPEGVHMDSYPGPLGQVITNLSLNALVHGFSDERPGVVTISARPLSGQQLELVVSDDGAGIPADHLARVFDPFFTTKLGKGGSGLGLHIVYTLVTRVLGGSIAVDSPPAGGARLTLRLPLTAPEAKADATAPA